MRRTLSACLAASLMLMAGGVAASQTPREQRGAATTNPELNEACNFPVGEKSPSGLAGSQTNHIIQGLQAAEVPRSLGINVLFREWLIKGQIN